MARLEFFFDLTSPWTYLAFHKIEALCAQSGAELIWRPILVGGVFNVANPELYEQRAKMFALAEAPDSEPSAPGSARARYFGKDLQDWARLYGLRISLPTFHPARAVEVMRGAYVALDRGRIAGYARVAFEAYFGDQLDVSKPEVLAGIARASGLEPDEFFDRITSPEIKSRLREATDELVTRGGFGSPTFFVDGGDMYFGNDRLPLVQAAIERA